MPSSLASVETTVGIISDTHGSLDEAAVIALSGCSHIIHAGDFVDDTTLPTLRRICPVTAVRGNMDRGTCGIGLPRTAVVEVAGVVFFALHDLGGLDLEPEAAGFHVVVHGHTHRPDIERRGEVLFVNPGSASRPRGGPATVALVTVGPGGPEARVVPLESR